jgi:hypothetical protein
MTVTGAVNATVELRKRRTVVARDILVIFAGVLSHVVTVSKSRQTLSIFRLIVLILHQGVLSTCHAEYFLVGASRPSQSPRV